MGVWFIRHPRLSEECWKTTATLLPLNAFQLPLYGLLALCIFLNIICPVDLFHPQTPDSCLLGPALAPIMQNLPFFSTILVQCMYISNTVSSQKVI